MSCGLLSAAVSQANMPSSLHVLRTHSFFECDSERKGIVLRTWSALGRAPSAIGVQTNSEDMAFFFGNRRNDDNFVRLERVGFLSVRGERTKIG